eukprot:1119564-Amphidinium_carterae.1
MATWRAVPHNCASLAAVVEPAHHVQMAPVRAWHIWRGSGQRDNVAYVTGHVNEIHQVQRAAAVREGRCVCICKQPGLTLQRMWNKCQAFLKQKVKTGNLHTALMTGSLVVRWSQSEVGENENPTAVYSNIALQYLRPWEPTWLVLRRVVHGVDSMTEAVLEQLALLDNLEVQVCLDFMPKAEDEMLHFTTSLDILARFAPEAVADGFVGTVAQTGAIPSARRTSASTFASISDDDMERVGCGKERKSGSVCNNVSDALWHGRTDSASQPLLAKLTAASLKNKQHLVRY